MEHWTDNVTHQDLQSPEAKAILSKFNTADDAHVGYIQLQKAAGKPFKLPDSLDKLPDDTTRADFSSKVGKLMGAVETEEAMSDINFAEGLPDANMVNKDLVTAFKQFAIANKLPKSVVAAVVKFNTQQSVLMRNASHQAAIDTATKVNGELLPMFGGEEGIKKHNEDVKRMFQNHGGLTDDEFQAVIPGLVDSGITKSTPLSKALYNIAAKFGEGKTDTPGGPGPKPGEQTIKDELPVTAGILGW
jgi:hypothetical protein